jgi:hypothetical protein
VRRWAVLKNSFLALYKGRDDPLPEAVMLFDTDTALQVHRIQMGQKARAHNCARGSAESDAIDVRVCVCVLTPLCCFALSVASTGLSVRARSPCGGEQRVAV